MKDVWVLLLVWGCTALPCMMGRVWWAAIRTGRWLKGGGYWARGTRSRTFTIYDRINNPYLYWTGIIALPAIFVFFLLASLLLTVGFMEHVPRETLALRPPPLPPLIAGYMTTGVGDICNGPMRSNVSPEFNQRLTEQFPIGTPADRLERTLAEQGFRERPLPCKNDLTIQAASFCGRHGLRVGPRVEVFWKSDGDGKLLMTAGTIFYIC